MRNFKIVPLSAEQANQIRNAGKDDFGNEVLVQVANGKGPCRQSLKPFNKGIDNRILFSYSPFKNGGLYAGAGPVFIHEKPVESYQDIYQFPPEIKADKDSFPLTLIGYNNKDMMVFTQLVGNQDVDLLIESLFNQNASIAYLHARNAAAGCFICAIERR